MWHFLKLRFNLKNIVYLFVIAIISSVAISVVIFSYYLQTIGTTNPRAHAKETTASPVRGQSGDLWADIILGKSNFNEITPNTVVADRLNKPRSVVVDRSQTPNKLYVYDLNDSRILGIDLSTCLASPSNPKHCTPSLIFGQPAATPTDPGFGMTSACNGDSAYQNFQTRSPASAQTLCGLQESQLNTAEGGSSSSMAVDSQGNLYVTDFWNNRVLKYNSPFSADKTGGKGDTIADDVWGQNDFTGVNCNRTATGFWQYVPPDASSLCFSPNVPTGADTPMAGVDVDASGAVWVADPDNNRVLRFPAGSHTADLVLGQTSFTTSGGGSSLNQLNRPIIVRVANNGVYVSDLNNRRILFYADPVTTGMSGTVYLDNSTGLLPNGATGMDVDPQGRGLWLAYHTCNSGFNKYDLYNFSTPPTIAQTLAGVLCETMGSIGIDSQGNYFAGVEAGDFGHDVVMWPAGGPYNQTNISLFQGGTNVAYGYRAFANQKDAHGLGGPTSVALYEGAVGSQLIVLDGQIKYWNDLSSLTTYKAADGMAEVTDFGSRLNGLNGSYLVIQKSNSNLYAITSGNDFTGPGILIYPLPLTPGEHYSRYIGLPLPLLGGGTFALPANPPAGQPGMFWGVAPSADDSFVWVTDTNDSRVFRIRNPLTNPVVDAVLGQADQNDVLCNRVGNQGVDQNILNATPTTLCKPGALALDQLGDLWVSDSSLEIEGNVRLVEYDSSVIPTNNANPIFGPATNKIFPRFQTWQPAFDSRNHMVVGQGEYWNSDPNRFFPTVFLNPLSGSTAPDSYLSDFQSFQFSLGFDSQDNLYVADGSRGRVLIYKNPLNINQPTVTQAPTPTPTPSKITFSNIFSTSTATAATITWTTSAPGNSRVFYGLKPNNLNFVTPENKILAIDHSITITSLQNNSIYYFSVHSRNALGLDFAAPILFLKTLDR